MVLEYCLITFLQDRRFPIVDPAKERDRSYKCKVIMYATSGQP